METADKHYKLINSKTGYAINYHTLKGQVSMEIIKVELEKIKAQVAIQNNLFSETLYWEEIKEEE